MAQGNQFPNPGRALEKRCSDQSMLSLVKGKGFDVKNTSGSKTIPFDSDRFENSLKDALKRVGSTEEYKKFAADFRGNLSSVESMTTELEMLKAKKVEFMTVQEQYKKAIPSLENEYRVELNLPELARRRDFLKAETERMEKSLIEKVYARFAAENGCLRQPELTGEDLRKLRRDSKSWRMEEKTPSEIAFEQIVKELGIKFPKKESGILKEDSIQLLMDHSNSFEGMKTFESFCQSITKSSQIVSSIAIKISEETRERELQGFEGIENAKDFLNALSMNVHFSKVGFDSVKYFNRGDGTTFWILQKEGKPISAHIMKPKDQGQTIMDSIAIDPEKCKLKVNSILRSKSDGVTHYVKSGLVNNDVCKIMQKYNSVPDAWEIGFDSSEQREKNNCELQGGRYTENSECRCSDKKLINSFYDTCFKVRALSPLEKMANEIGAVSSKNADFPNIGNKELSQQVCANYFPPSSGDRNNRRRVETNN